MSKIKISELKVSDSELKELSELETGNVIGGYSERSSAEIINEAIKNALIRSDIAQNSNAALKSQNTAG
ncbi:MAG: hypothetical protein QNJ53_15000 [Pleurocapsa sp. MO_192.B19]|nr:hypothetical protein [Pleurocapsa sp. MO_192.B19]